MHITLTNYNNLNRKCIWPYIHFLIFLWDEYGIYPSICCAFFCLSFHLTTHPPIYQWYRWIQHEHEPWTLPFSKDNFIFLMTKRKCWNHGFLPRPLCRTWTWAPRVWGTQSWFPVSHSDQSCWSQWYRTIWRPGWGLGPEWEPRLRQRSLRWACPSVSPAGPLGLPAPSLCHRSQSLASVSTQAQRKGKCFHRKQCHVKIKMVCGGEDWGRLTSSFWKVLFSSASLCCNCFIVWRSDGHKSETLTAHTQQMQMSLKDLNYLI